VCVLEPGLGRTRIGRLWVYVRDDRPRADTAPPAAIYFYSPDRSDEHPDAHVASCPGYLQANGYSGFFDALYNPARETMPVKDDAQSWCSSVKLDADPSPLAVSAGASIVSDMAASLYVAKFSAAALAVLRQRAPPTYFATLFLTGPSTVNQSSVWDHKNRSASPRK
jgi:hypothetical protein